VIARQLGLSKRTVDNHRSTLLLKLGLDNSIELTRILASLDQPDL
jgi:DNA-binding NarL/FixJ family response regulator